MDNIIKQAYESYNFPSVAKLYRILKSEGHQIRTKDIQHFIDTQQEQQIHKVVRKKRKGIPITSVIKDFNYQADLLDFQKYATKNKNYNWLLIVIDVLTKKAAAIPLKKKTKEETYRGLHKAFDFISNGNMPFALTTDKGKEFFKVKEDNLIHKTANIGDHRVLGVIDRFSKTMKNIISKYMTRNQNQRWIYLITKIINAYNNTPHSSIGNMTPNQAARNPDKAIHIALDRYQNAKQIQRKEFKVGDTVRLLNKKTIVDKGYDANYSFNVFTIESIEGNYYYLNDGNKYRAYMLQKVHPKTVLSKKKDIQKKAKKKRIRKLLLNREDIRPERIERRRRNWQPSEKYLERYG